MQILQMNKPGQRLKGIAIIVYSLIPVILVLVFFILLLSVALDVKHLVRKPLEQLSSTLVAVKADAEQAGVVIGSAIEPLKQIREDVSQSLQQVGSLSTQITLPDIGIPSVNLPVKPNVNIGSGFPPAVNVEMTTVPVAMPTIPGFTVTVPGLQQVQEVLTSNLRSLSSINNIVSGIPNLDALRAAFQTIASNARSVFRSIQWIGIKVLILLVLGAIVIIPILIRLYITPYTKWFYSQFNKGLALVRSASH